MIPASIFFGGLEGGAGATQRFAGVPAAWVGGVEALVILSVLAVERGVRRLGRDAVGLGSEGASDE